MNALVKQKDDKHVVVNRIMSTKDTDFFKMSKYNRRINKTHLEKLKNSIKTEGQWEPIKITNDGTIIDGHHRYLAIKSIKENDNADFSFVYMVVEAQDEIDRIIKYNSMTRNWTTADYIDIYAIDRNPDYKKIIDIAAKYNQSASGVLATLSCGANTFKYSMVIKNGGELNFDNWDLLDEYYAWIEDLKKYIHLKQKVIQNLFRLYLHDRFNKEIFVKHAKAEFINTNEKLRFGTNQNICKKQLLDLHNKGLVKNSKMYIRYMMDADNKIHLK